MEKPSSSENTKQTPMLWNHFDNEEYVHHIVKIQTTNIDSQDNQKQQAEHLKKSLQTKEATSIRKWVDFVFKQHPELAEIGTPEQYSQYLETVFPDSYVQNIVYHWGRQGIETFTKPHDESFQKNKWIGSWTKDYGIYFTADFSLAKHYSKSHKKRYIYPVLLNITNPYRANTRFALNIRKFFGSSIINPQSITDKDYQKFKENHQDGIIRHWEKWELIVFEPEQIHMLGSNKDNEAFKTFVNSTQK